MKTSKISRLVVALTAAGLAGVLLLHPSPLHASYSSGENLGNLWLTSAAVAPNGGFWLQQDDKHTTTPGGTYNLNGAPDLGNTSARGIIVAAPNGLGYWIVTPWGHIVAKGDAPSMCDGDLRNCSGFEGLVEQFIVSAAATPDGKDLWALSQNRAVWTTGTARSYGDGKRGGWSPLAYYVAAIAPTPTGEGYVIVTASGQVRSFGDAPNYGSPGTHGGHSSTGIAWSLDGSGKPNGYWVVEDDGGVFVKGNAPFLGSSGGDDGGSKVVNLIALNHGRSYAWIHQDGRIDFSRPPASAMDETGRGESTPAYLE